jgi:hypothetical protein
MAAFAEATATAATIAIIARLIMCSAWSILKGLMQARDGTHSVNRIAVRYCRAIRTMMLRRSISADINSNGEFSHRGSCLAADFMLSIGILREEHSCKSDKQEISVRLPAIMFRLLRAD